MKIDNYQLRRRLHPGNSAGHTPGSERISIGEVMRVERKEGILERAAKALDLPGEMVAGIPRVEPVSYTHLTLPTMAVV